MVKNAGGNKSKKVARKNVSYTSTQDVRKAADASEMYAAVSKIYSSQRCSVIGADGNTYQCTIRGKFLKNKRSGDGLVNGAWVLIGFYDWEVRSDGSKKCDLLEIYSNLEKDKLKQLETRHLAELIKIDGSDGGNCTFSSFHNDKKHAEEDGSSSDGDDDNVVIKHEPIKHEPIKHEPIKHEPIMPVIPIKKETAQEQLDWLTISDRDI
jgi:hypothetical protein